jgi:DNA-binding MarR family transcriptional regulator
MALGKRLRLAERLHSVAIHVLRHAREADRASGLGPARLSALSVLVYGGASTLGELAQAEQVTAPTMTRIVQALEADGFVQRKAAPDDARAVIVRATRKGEDVLERARYARLERIESLLASCDTEDLDLLGEALARVFPPS